LHGRALDRFKEVGENPPPWLRMPDFAQNEEVVSAITAIAAQWEGAANKHCVETCRQQLDYIVPPIKPGGLSTAALDRYLQEHPKVSPVRAMRKEAATPEQSMHFWALCANGGRRRALMGCAARPLFRALGPADEYAGEDGVMTAAHPIVVHKQELSCQGQINQARIRATAGEMQTPAGRSLGAAEPALVGGCDRLAGPIGLAVCAEPVADPNQDDLVVVLPPRPDPGGKRCAGAIDSVAGATRLAGPSRPSPQDRWQTRRRHIRGVKH
jgi:hypothetical protein